MTRNSKRFLALGFVAGMIVGAGVLFAVGPGVPGGDRAEVRPDAGAERGAAPGRGARGRGGPGGGPGGGRGGGRPSPVVVAPVELDTIGNRVAAVGTGRAVQSLTLSARVSGVVEEIRFSAGDRVTEDQTLMVLGREAEQIAVKLATVKLDEAAAALKRYETLSARDAVTVVQLEQARTAHAVARAELEARQYELDRRTIRAPFEGVIGITSLSRGDFVRDDTPIATIDDRSRLVVAFVVSERAAPHIRLGQEVRVTTPAIVGAVFQGTVSARDSRIDATSRTLRVEATVPNPDDRLLAGMTFSVDLRIEGEKLPSMPGLAIQWDRGGAHVWRVTEKNVAERVAVTIRRREDDFVSVEGELAEGDRVVIEGGQNLRDGAPVSLVIDQ